jgi:acylpyruvate hydrolase
MRLATISTPSGHRLHVRGRSGYVDLAGETGNEELSGLNSFLRAGPAAVESAQAMAERDGREYEPSDLGPAVPSPPRVLCIGLNYSEHAIEGGREAAPSWPESFVRGAGSVLGPYDDLVKPAFSGGFDYEGELGIVIGKGGRYIAAEEALSVIAGFVVLNDASARDWQRAGTQWTPGKNFDASMPIGPELVSVDELDIGDLALTTRLNGEVMQAARTSQMIVDVPGSVEFFSSFTTLRPGDVIATGTPGGVGFARTPPVWLEVDDVVEVEIEEIGTIRNRVVAEEGAPREWRWMPKGVATQVL